MNESLNFLLHRYVSVLWIL